MDTSAIIFEKPGSLLLDQLELIDPARDDVVAETLMSGISTGTEKMLFEGSMPTFPGMSYPLVPGYESVARVVEAGPTSGRRVGDIVFAPGASCFKGAAGLFGASASRLVLAGQRAIPVPADIAEDAILLALAATAHHAVKRAGSPVDIVIGHGVLGRLIARIACTLDQQPPRVLENCADRRSVATQYEVSDPEADDREGSCHCIIDASGNQAALDPAIKRLERGGELVLAGFYGKRVSFDFPSAFMREITISLASEFKPEDIHAVLALVVSGALSLQGLVTHHAPPSAAESAYRTAFGDPSCLKMAIDWRNAA
ncbi:chlorophyll synthesis pathway protein BchC [Rhodobacterales bacterium]|nr:chlorophyll synthesis pathway protein BchC [Rhodobacterales bacterium]